MKKMNDSTAPVQSDLPAPENRKQALKSRLSSAGCQLIYEETVGSTNEETLALWQKGAKTPCIFLADIQTRGRGRFDRVWESKKGASLTFSLLLCPECKAASFPMLTIVFALAVREALFRNCGCDAGIKWPNDVILSNRKVCGILTVMTPDQKAAVIGAGINLKRTAYPEELEQKAISLEEICPAVPEADDLIVSIYDCFSRKMEIFRKTGDLRELKKEYCSHLVNIGRQVTMKKKTSAFTGTALGIDDLGRLIFRKNDGETVLVGSGEVSVRGIYGE